MLPLFIPVSPYHNLVVAFLFNQDQGRVDESRVTEGRYVLQSTLKSRGWPHEQRVKAVVEAMEAERGNMARLLFGN